MGISGLEPEIMMRCAMKITEQIINLWKTILCKCIAVLVSHFLTFQNVPVLITFSQIPLHLLSDAYAGSRIQPWNSSNHRHV